MQIVHECKLKKKKDFSCIRERHQLTFYSHFITATAAKLMKCFVSCNFIYFKNKQKDFFRLSGVLLATRKKGLSYIFEKTANLHCEGSISASKHQARQKAIKTFQQNQPHMFPYVV